MQYLSSIHKSISRITNVQGFIRKRNVKMKDNDEGGEGGSEGGNEDS